MTAYHYLIIARIVHVLGVVLWIGGVAFVTTVLIPALRRLPDTKERFELFEKLERRFAWQARIVTLLTGLSGLYMLHAYNAWARYLSPVYWWMHLMTFVWLVFTLVLFVLEPAFLHRWFSEQAAKDSENAFRWLNRMHILLLTISLVAVVGAIAGARGWNIFS
jgi:uncharacterized membrane protein